MPLYDFREFQKLSADLSYQLVARGVGGPNCLSIILDRKCVADAERAILLDVLYYLEKAYAGRTRRLGSLAVLHPLRSAALLVRARGTPQMLEILTELLHDKGEDLHPSEDLEYQFMLLMKKIDPKDEWYLMERLDWLTRRPDETYLGYCGRLLDHARETPEVVRAKLADRLDNVLDVRIDIDDPMPVGSFFEICFKVMFEKSFTGFRPEGPHPPPAPLNGADRLYQLFKSATVLSLVRQKQVPLDETALRLFAALSHACMLEAQRTALHIWGFHMPDVREQRDLLLSTMEYVQGDGMERVTLPSHAHPLDGLFTRCFDHGEKAQRHAALKALYADKPLMVMASLAFVVLFQRFLDDPDYCMAGISEAGLEPR